MVGIALTCVFTCQQWCLCVQVARWLWRALKGQGPRRRGGARPHQLCDCHKCMEDLDYGLRTMQCVLGGCALSDGDASDSSEEEDDFGGEADEGWASDEGNRLDPERCCDQRCALCNQND